MDFLTDYEREAMFFIGKHKMTLEWTAAQLGIENERIEEIYKNACMKIKKETGKTVEEIVRIF